MRFHGAVGYASNVETTPGVWQEVITETQYTGDVIRNTRRLEAVSTEPPKTNADLSLGNSFSVMADDHAYANFMNMRYVQWEGLYWKITDVEVRRPRLVLTVGGLWDGNKA
jgi:hypothetical protein